jgi:peptidoglycan/xylan/chitin deacetylase (PgdA/CDA1 family)
MQSKFVGSKLAAIILWLVWLPLPLFGQTKQVAVTIDDLPAVLTSNYQDQLKINRKILAALERYHVHATGFVIGDRVSGRDEIFALWLEGGHELGNHTYSHLDLDKVNAKVYEVEIVKGAFEIEKLLLHHNQSLRYFRFPYLHTGRDTEKGDLVRKFLKENCYTIAPVTINPYDWEYNSWYVKAWGSHKPKEEERIKRLYLERIESATAEAESTSWVHYGRNIKQILLLHLNRLNGETLDQVLDYYVRSGYTFITLEEALADSAYLPDGELTKPHAFTWPVNFKLSLPLDK